MAHDIIDDAVPEDRLFRRELGAFSLAMMTFSGMVGTGWLFAAYYSATIAGPLALASWVIAGIFTIITGLIYVELGVINPISGGTIRWPQVASGPFVGALLGWVTFLSIGVGTPSEAAGLLQYASHWWPALFNGTGLTIIGLIAATVVLGVLTLLNFFTIRRLANLNNVFTIVKIVIPFGTVILLIASGFHSGNFTHHGGWAPFGASAMLSAVITGGLVYSFGGINLVASVAGEVRDPRRNVPLGTFIGFGLAFLLYLLLQLTFIGVLPTNELVHGWHGINFNSPFAQLAVLVNLVWLQQILLADAVFSPSAGLLIGLTSQARITYGLAENRTLPRIFGRVDPGTGVPRIALVFNFVLGIIFLFFFRSWHTLVEMLGAIFAITYATASVAAVVFKLKEGAEYRGWVPGLEVLAAINFVVSGLIIFWSGWSNVQAALLFLVIFILVYALLSFMEPMFRNAKIIATGLWFYLFLLFISLMSYIGNYGGGRGLIQSPWVEIVVALGSLGFFLVGVRSGLAWHRGKEVKVWDSQTGQQQPVALTPSSGD